MGTKHCLHTYWAFTSYILHRSRSTKDLRIVHSGATWFPLFQPQASGKKMVAPSICPFDPCPLLACWPIPHLLLLRLSLRNLRHLKRRRVRRRSLSPLLGPQKSDVSDVSLWNESFGVTGITPKGNSLCSRPKAEVLHPEIGATPPVLFQGLLYAEPLLRPASRLTGPLSARPTPHGFFELRKKSTPDCQTLFGFPRCTFNKPPQWLVSL